MSRSAFSDSLRARYTAAAESLSDFSLESLGNPVRDIETGVPHLAERFAAHCFDPATGSVVQRLAEKDSMYFAELWLRYLQHQVLRVVHTAHPEQIPSSAKIKQRTSVAGRLKFKSWYRRDDRFDSHRAVKALPATIRKELALKTTHVPLWDLGSARRWFSRNLPVEGESTWELYKRFDPEGARRLNLDTFSALIPKAWKVRGHYLRFKATYADCLVAERWFASNQPIPGETTWELYRRFDPAGKRQMHLGGFFSLLPKSWRERDHYETVMAPYLDCVSAEKWFAGNHAIDGETTWELYQRFDPEGERRLHLAGFYSLMPRSWREREHYQYLHATYDDCVKAQIWFGEHGVIEGETTWELYKRFDPLGERKMNQGRFASLVPRSWRERNQYCAIQASYEDCVKAEKWFTDNRPIEGETSWELYGRFDPRGLRAMYQGSFYSLMPKSWRRLDQYQAIEATHQDCLKAEAWFATNRPIEAETTWELYQRFDPSGERAMNQSGFYSLMPRSWRARAHYQKMAGTYRDWLRAERWFAENQPITGESSWALYRRFDPEGERALHQGHFYLLIPRAWREQVGYQKVEASFDDCLKAESWFAENQPREGESSWDLYQRFDPEGLRRMNQRSFFTLIPEAWKLRHHYSPIEATYDDCRRAEEWFAVHDPIEGETSWELYKRFDPQAQRRMNQAGFFSLLPEGWRQRRHYLKILGSYDDCLKAEGWFAANMPVDGETSWELYKRFDPDGVRKMNQDYFFSLIPRSWLESGQYQKFSTPYEDCLKAERWFAENLPRDGETSWELYRRFDPFGERRMHQSGFFSLIPRAWRNRGHYEKISAGYDDCVKAEAWFAENQPLAGEGSWELYKRFDCGGDRRMHQSAFYSLIPADWRRLRQYEAILATHEDCLEIEARFGTVSPRTVREFFA